MYFPRQIENRLMKHLESDDDHIVLLAGARQTGKTTLVENLKFDRPKVIVNLWDEDPEIKALRGASTLDMLERYLWQFFKFKPDGETILVIDEAQASAHLGRMLMQVHRKWKGQKVLLLGSVLSNLFGRDVPMPTGRTVEFVLRPLSFFEFLGFRGKGNYLELLPEEPGQDSEKFDVSIHEMLFREYELFCQTGGLPGIVNAFVARHDVQLLFESLLGNIYRDADRLIGRDVVQRGGRAAQYGSLVEHCLKSIGHHTSFSSQNSTILSTDSPAYRSVLPRVFEALKAWHLAYFIQNETKQQTSKKGYSSKKYVFDTGLLNYLINNFMPVSLREGSEVGAKLLENVVLQELLTLVYSTRNIVSFKSSNKSSNELDFVATIGGRRIPIEVKLSSKINRKAMSQLFSFMEHQNVDEGIVVYTGLPRVEKIDKKTIYYLPPYYLSFYLKSVCQS
jgi:uncharacterized protein